jgi:hypothetical protein
MASTLAARRVLAYGEIRRGDKKQAGERDPKRREALPHRIQPLIHDNAMFLPIWQLALRQGVGPRVAESGLGLIADHPQSAPYEDLKLKAR